MTEQESKNLLGIMSRRILKAKQDPIIFSRNANKGDIDVTYQTNYFHSAYKKSNVS